MAALPRLAAILALCLGATGALLAPAAQATGPQGVLDARGWELVSPVDKNGGEVGVPGTAQAGVTQAASQAGAIAFGSAASFGEAEGAAPVSQYLSTRQAAAWSTANLTPPLYSGTYAEGAYQLFSKNLSRAILTNGWACREGGEGCEAENPPLAQGAPAGYRNLYLREGTKYTPLISEANAPALSVPAKAFRLSLQGASPDLGQVVISTCAALSPNAIEVPLGEGCDPAAQNLYEWSEGTLRALNLLPGETQSSPGASLAAPSGAISTDGQRVYFTQAGNLYLRQGTETLQVDEALGGGGAFQIASADGSIAFFTKEGHLYRYRASTEEAVELAPEVQGVLGASADGSYLYYLTSSGLFLRQGETTTKVAAAADEGDYPPSTGTARVTPDGSRLAFLSKASLTGYANVGKAEVFLYEAPAKHLLCVSCNPRGTTPAGPASIPGAIGVGEAPLAYKPRALTEEGTRLFFDSGDALLFSDSDGRPDAYQWEAKGTGGCTKTGGCLGLLSSGRAGEGTFLDASADGSDAYFLTEASLLPQDTASRDVYDARASGGFPEAPPILPCEGDDCQGPPPGPDDPTPGTAILEGPANPPLRWAKQHRKKHHRRHHHKRHHHGGRK